MCTCTFTFTKISYEVKTTAARHDDKTAFSTYIQTLAQWFLHFALKRKLNTSCKGLFQGTTVFEGPN